MGFSVGPEVEKDQTIRRLWFEGGDRVRHDQITPLHVKLITAYIDYRDFGIRPWKRGAEAADIPPFWKIVLRGFKRLEHEAEQYKREKEAMKNKRKSHMAIGQQPTPQQQQQATTTTTGGVPPSDDAARDYMSWRKKRILQQQQQRMAHRRQIEQYQQQQEKEQRRQRAIVRRRRRQ